MIRSSLLAVLAIAFAASAPAQSPSTGPTIDLSASGSVSGTGQGSVSVSGNITLPAPWQLSIHVVTVRYQKDGSGKTLNAFIPVKGANFSANIDLKKGAYTVWAVIDVKDADGKEKQIASDPQNVNLP